MSLESIGWLFVVGPAAAGKTYVAKEIQRNWPGSKLSGDLDALRELFWINDCFNDGIEVDESRLRYWPEGLAAPESGFRTSKSEGGGHSIIDPQVWDECVERAGRFWRRESRLLFEFARGLDRSYAELHGVEPEEFYWHTFKLLAERFPERVNTSARIVHVTASYEKRRERNEIRRLNGDHFVGASTMDSVYSTDTFRFLEFGKGIGVLGVDLPIPVISIDNSGTELALLNQVGVLVLASHSEYLQ